MEKKNLVRSRRKFDAKFKAEALEMVNSGRRVSEVSRILGIGENLLYNWRSEAQSLLPPENQRLVLVRICLHE